MGSLKELKRMLSKLGVASRKDAEELIRAGRVTVNGVIIRNPIQPVFIDADIRLDRAIIPEKKLVVYAMNKPRGVITTMSKTETRPTVADLLPDLQYLFPVGRLDKASRGLLLFTNDNEFSDQILSPKEKIMKIYRVQIKGIFSPEHLRALKEGVEIAGEKYAMQAVELIRTNPRTSWLEVTLTTGKNREIRKLLEVFGYEVLDLVRIQIGKLKLKDLNLEPGEYTLTKKQLII